MAETKIDLSDQNAIVTGGAAGMGLAMAESFARVGMNIVLADVEVGALKESAERIEALGATAVSVQTDVSDEADMDHLGELVRGRFGAPEILCLNAGVAGGRAAASAFLNGAAERTRTSTGLPPPAPQAGASTSSATAARLFVKRRRT